MKKGFVHKIETGYTGRLLEEEALGMPVIPEDQAKNYMKYEEALSFVKDKQPFAPDDPEPRFANDLHASVAEKLGLKDYSDLRFFTAVSTPLDIFHGVDAFLELVDKKRGSSSVVTLDLSNNPQKDACRADVLVKMPPGGLDPVLDKEKYKEKLEHLSSEVAEKLLCTR